MLCSSGRAACAAIVLLLLPQLASAGGALDSTLHKKAEPPACHPNCGRVAGVFTYGAPGSASPGLLNRVNGSYDGPGCFEGIRAWNAASRLSVRTVDAVALITSAVGYEHLKMSTVEFDMTKKDVRDVKFTSVACTDETIRRPAGRGAVGEPTLHLKTTYSRNARMQGGFYASVSELAGVNSYFFSQDFVRERAKLFGWRLVDTAINEGHGLQGGRQPSHLFQNPETLECLITFQGSQSAQDWIGNAVIVKTHFCGLVDEGEECGITGGCSVKRRGGSFVHKGFRDHLRSMVTDETWQQKIRPHLPFCAKVHVGGHSLGGAVSELFAACVNRAPERGSYQYEDFAAMSWIPDTPTRLRYF